MIRKIAVSGMIAALYAALTVALSPLSFGPVQFRVAEALTLLPFFMPEAIPGLFIGCFLSNIAGGFGLIDIVVGSSATLAAAWLTYKTNSIWLAALPPVLINALAVGTYLGIITDTPVMYSILYIGISQAVICFCIGIPLCMLIASRTEIFDREALAGRRVKKWVDQGKKRAEPPSEGCPYPEKDQHRYDSCIKRRDKGSRQKTAGKDSRRSGERHEHGR